MKRLRSSSSPLSPLHQSICSGNVDALREYYRRRDAQALLSSAHFDMAPGEVPGNPLDISVPHSLSTTRSSHQSRPSSPRGPNSDAQYRGCHLRRANIFIDDHEALWDVNDYAEREIFHGLTSDFSVGGISERFSNKAKELVKKPFSENEWMNALYEAIYELSWEGIEFVSDRDWHEDVKPPVNNPRPTTIIPQKRDQPMPVFQLKDPCPNICIGLSDETLAGDLGPHMGDSARSFLPDLQDTSTLISDPNILPSGLRFPFLMVEAKSSATGGNLYQAQNQAAVSGSSALQIFRNLSDLQDIQDSYRRNGPAGYDDSGLTDLNLAFSITTEGPTHELWLHLRRFCDDEFYMVCMGSWRVTNDNASRDFLCHVAAVLRWGHGKLKNSIVSTLKDL